MTAEEFAAAARQEFAPGAPADAVPRPAPARDVALVVAAELERVSEVWAKEYGYRQEAGELWGLARQLREGPPDAAVAAPSVNEPRSVEQMCRDLLSAAVHVDRSVRTRGLPLPDYDPDPQARSSGELVAMANLLAGFLAAATAAERERCLAIARRWADTRDIGDVEYAGSYMADNIAHEIGRGT